MRRRLKLNNRRALILILALTAVCAAACQSTPDEPPVIGKTDDFMSKIHETPDPQFKINAEDRWQETLDFQDGVHINIDAEVDVPDVPNFPVVEVKPHEFTQEEVQKFVDYFIQGQPLYEPDFVQTKDDIMGYIISAQAELAKVESGTYDSEDSRQKDINMYTESLRYYKEEYDKAPEKAPDLKPTTVEFKKDGNPGSGTDRAILLKAFLEGGLPVYLGALIQDSKQSVITFRIISTVHLTGDLDATDTPLAGVKITRQEAQAKADELLEKLGITDLKLSSTKVLAETVSLLAPDSIKDLSDPDTKKCFKFSYIRFYDNIPITNVQQFYGMNLEMSCTTRHGILKKSRYWLTTTGSSNLHGIPPATL